MLHTVYKAQYSKFTCAYINSRIKKFHLHKWIHSEYVCYLCEESAVLTVLTAKCIIFKNYKLNKMCMF